MSRRTPAYAAGRRAWLLGIGAGDIRRACGIPQAAVATALGVSQPAVRARETGRNAPVGAAGEAYCRLIAALGRHLDAEMTG